jgi:ElaB/YqjD/DUF883 family membrane-anchored ribosome-binding protein
MVQNQYGSEGFGQTETESAMRSEAERTLNRLTQQPQLTYQPRLTLEGVQEVASNMKSAIDKSLREQPMATVAMAAIVGFVLGTIWKA